MQHALAKLLVGRVLDGPEESDAYLAEILRLGNVAAGARVDIGVDVVEVVGRGELGVGTHVSRLAGIRSHGAVPRRARRMRSTFTNACGGTPVLPCRSILPRNANRSRRSNDACGGQDPSLAVHGYSLLPATFSVRNMAMASISISSSGLQRCAWMPVEAGSGSSPCSLKNLVRSSLNTS